MVFILLTYGGWNEAAYLSGEIQDVKRNMVRALMLGVVVIVTLYVLINFAYLYVLGLEGLRKSNAVGADLMKIVAGQYGAIILSLIVCITAASTLNGTVFTGARSYYALGRDVSDLPPPRHLGGARTDPGQRTDRARRHRHRADPVRVDDARRLRGHGRLHRAGVLAVHVPGGDLDHRLPHARARRASCRSGCRSIRCRR